MPPNSLPSGPAAPWQRWLQFRLRTLLVLTLLAAVFTAWYGPRIRFWTNRASVGGKYATLLRRITVAQDEGVYGEFCDWGPWGGSSYRGYADLPPGHWVYVAPDWYIWKEKLRNEPPARYDTPVGPVPPAIAAPTQTPTTDSFTLQPTPW